MLDYYQAVERLDSDDVTQAEKREALQTLEQLWDNGFAMAAHHLGRAWWKGLGILPDDEEAEFWFRQFAEAGAACSQYALGTLLQEQGRMNKTMVCYKQAADAGNQTSQYRLGKLYLQGNMIPKDITKAERYLAAAAEQGSQYAQYALGKLYLAGNEAGQGTCRLLADAVCRTGESVRTAPIESSKYKSVSGSTVVSRPAALPYKPGIPGDSSALQSGRTPCTTTCKPCKKNFSQMTSMQNNGRRSKPHAAN